MGTLTEAVNRLLSSLQISSASPGHINEVLQTDPSIDLDEALEEATTDRGTKKELELEETTKKVDRWNKGNVGNIQTLSSQTISSP